MKLFLEVVKAILSKLFLRESNGKILKRFCSNMGLVYIKAAQILSTQNIGTTFTEEDRVLISSLCDDCEKVSFDIIKKIIESEYCKPIEEVFDWIDIEHPKAASISQVYEAKLKNGEKVAVKVKRLDITRNIDKDIATIRMLMNRFGRYVGFKNLISGNKALDMYFDWILQEVNFIHEVENIKEYQEFANSVNGKVIDTKNIIVPNVYLQLSTENIVVMEYIDSPTINRIKLTEKNKEIIKKALNSYLQSSFYALFHDQEVVFHGDPHGGNIFVDENGNIGFLDMGLLAVLSLEECQMTNELFFAAYTKDIERLYSLLIKDTDIQAIDKNKFKKDLGTCLEKIQSMPVTSYFTEMIGVYVDHNLSAPDFLFKMAKAFICLNGISCFSDNTEKATELLKKQVTEYYITKTVKDSYSFSIKCLKLSSKIFTSVFKYGLEKGIIEQMDSIGKTFVSGKSILSDIKTMLSMFEKANYEENKQKHL